MLSYYWLDSWEQIKKFHDFDMRKWVWEYFVFKIEMEFDL